jgi:Na+-transporting NADH:ubiquinone oxidoreductase subunit B
MNPALASRAFLFFAYPAQMTGDKIWTAIDGITSATPLAILASSEPAAGLSGIGYSWWQLFLGTTTGAMGETSVLACTLGAVLLLVTGVAPWRVIVSMLIGGLIASLFFMMQGAPPNALYTVPPHYHLVLGSFAFGMVFMATDPVSASMTSAGRWIFGILIGFMCVLIRVINPAFPEGMMLAILFANIFAPLIDYVVIQLNIRRRQRRHVRV